MREDAPNVFDIIRVKLGIFSSTSLVVFNLRER